MLSMRVSFGSTRVGDLLHGACCAQAMLCIVTHTRVLPVQQLLAVWHTLRVRVAGLRVNSSVQCAHHRMHCSSEFWFCCLYPLIGGKTEL
jgi:hypothetical protein